MCGFVGFTGKLEKKAEYLKKMTDRIIHRGPDMEGEYISPDGEVALGFRRLSIIDLSEAGHQPMQNDDGSVVIVFNGEIYNFMEIRDDLISKGYSFKSRCDTEVLLHGYEEYGEDIVYRLRGMFAFVIWDAKRRSLFGARDFFGIKPFYYGKLPDGGLIFGSEIKSFLCHPGFIKRVNKNALRPYLTFQYSATEETFFEGVYKLLPAHFFKYSIDSGEMKTTRFWDADFKEDNVSFDECVKRLDDVINESVAAHRIADVKVGTFLSGGVDSSYITASMMPDKTFSVGFNYDKFNETDYARELSELLGIQNYRHMLSADECFDALPTIQYHMDEPQSNPSSVPLYYLAKLAAEHVTVVLSGEGADEIYAGYEWYDETPMMKKYKRLPRCIRGAAAKIAKRLPYFKGHDFIIKCSGRPEDYFIGQAYVFPENEASDILTEPYRCGKTPRELTRPVYDRVRSCDELIKKQYLDLNMWLPGDILLKADKMSMAHSLEQRVPFLDRMVMEDARKIPSAYKINGINTKYVLRQAAKKTIPDDWGNRPKVGFPVPIRYWFKEEKYYNYAKEYFNADFTAEFFDRGKLMRLLDDHKNEKANNARKIYTALTFLIWYKRFFIDEEINNR
jgi:asparagine synthase (glutamine-hydrolysing)